LIKDTKEADYHALVLPGGVINPDTLRTDENALQFIRDFFKSHKPVAAICHAPWLLISAGVIENREVTSYKSIKDDVLNAGATWLDKEVVVDSGLVTSRNPKDLPAFIAKVIEEIVEGKHEEQVTKA
jgi:protease I